MTDSNLKDCIIDVGELDNWEEIIIDLAHRINKKAENNV